MNPNVILAHAEQILNAFGALFLLVTMIIVGLMPQGMKNAKARAFGVVVWVLVAATVSMILILYARHPEWSSPF